MKLNNLSPLSEAAIELDKTFTEFQRLTDELEKRTIDSDRGLERACELLKELDLCGKQISAKMTNFTQALEGVRGLTEMAAQRAAVRANAVEQRRQEVEAMAERLRTFGAMVGQVTATMGELKRPKDIEMSDEEKTQLSQSASQVTTQLDILLQSADQLKQDAHDARMEAFERSAQGLRQSLQSARTRLNHLVGPEIAPKKTDANPTLLN